MECAKGMEAEIDADIAMDDADAINLEDEDDEEMRGAVYNFQSVPLKILFHQANTKGWEFGGISEVRILWIRCTEFHGVLCLPDEFVDGTAEFLTTESTEA